MSTTPTLGQLLERAKRFTEEGDDKIWARHDEMEVLVQAGANVVRKPRTVPPTWSIWYRGFLFVHYCDDCAVTLLAPLQ